MNLFFKNNNNSNNNKCKDKLILRNKGIQSFKTKNNFIILYSKTIIL